MKYLIFGFLMFQVTDILADSLQEIDENINKLVLSVIKQSASNESKNINTCQYNNYTSVRSLISCNQYVKGVYVTDDIDAYTNFIKKQLQVGIKAQKGTEFEKILSADYEEVTSKLFYDIAEMSYKYNRYSDALHYMKKIDDSLDEASVYSALLMYGLIYFEKNNLKKAKYYLSRIDPVSDLYLYSKYNLALISMRSSWWSEAEDYLNDAIKSLNLNKLDKKQSLVLDKIYLTLGYSQLNRKNYRLSKSSFSKISLESKIKSRALLAMAMSEIGLGNLQKAAPLLKYILKDPESDDYLDALVVLPQVYQHAGNIQETVNYYNSALSNMELRKKKTSNIVHSIKTMTIEEIVVSFPDSWEKEEIQNRLNLLQQFNGLKSITKSKQKQVSKIKKQLLRYSRDSISKLFNSKVKKLNSYTSQVKYALAVIYDSSVAEN